MSNCDSILPASLTSASATAASKSVLVLKTRMALTEPGMRPDWPSPNRSIQKTKAEQSVYLYLLSPQQGVLPTNNWANTC